MASEEIGGYGAADRTGEARQAETLVLVPTVWQTVYGDGPGFVALLSGQRDGRRLVQPQVGYWRWPQEADRAHRWVVGQAREERDLYHCAHLVTQPRRRKETAAPLASLYVDLDTGQLPAEVPPPSVLIQSSPGKLQCYWRLQTPVPPAAGEALNRQLGQLIGADRSGWDLTQLLRIPGSGKGETLPPPPPLRTVHESFPSHGSSRSVRPAKDAASPR